MADNAASVTTYADAVAHFTGGHPTAMRTLASWRSDPSKHAVVPHVERSESRALYGVTSEEVARTVSTTSHPLGDIKKELRDRVPSVRDWHPAFSFQHVLHHSLESTGRVLPYQEFRAFCASDAQARAMLLAPAAAMNVRAQSQDGASFDEARDALRWRVGLAYYSFLRELHVITALREAHIDVRCHVLADCLFRVDFWIGPHCFELFVTSPFFKGGHAGRKRGPAAYVGPSSRLVFHRLELPVQHEYGIVHLPSAPGAVAAVQGLLAAHTAG